MATLETLNSLVSADLVKPALYTLKVELKECSGIGTEATRAEIIVKLKISN